LREKVRRPGAHTHLDAALGRHKELLNDDFRNLRSMMMGYDLLNRNMSLCTH
jgi:hypothetical protein